MAMAPSTFLARSRAQAESARSRLKLARADANLASRPACAAAPSGVAINLTFVDHRALIGDETNTRYAYLWAEQPTQSGYVPNSTYAANSPNSSVIYNFTYASR